MRIRTIKPEFWMHEGLCKCSEFTRLLAIALLNWSDDEGYFMANPILIRGQVFPFLDDSKIIPRSLQDLSREGWIQLGKDNQGRDVGKVLNFSKHQRVDKPKPSEIKGCSTFQDASKIDPRLIQDASKEEWKGMEGNGKEKERKGSGEKSKGSIEDVKTFIDSLGLPESDAIATFHKWEGNGWTNSGKPIKDWKATIRAWAAQEFLPSQKNKPSAIGSTHAGIQNQEIIMRGF